MDWVGATDMTQKQMDRLVDRAMAKDKNLQPIINALESDDDQALLVQSLRARRLWVPPILLTGENVT